MILTYNMKQEFHAVSIQANAIALLVIGFHKRWTDESLMILVIHKAAFIKRTDARSHRSNNRSRYNVVGIRLFSC
jgi:hypothetical protein